MKITYDTVSDSISCPDTPSQTQALQAELSAALIRNDPVQTVAARIMTAVQEACWMITRLSSSPSAQECDLAIAA